MSSPTSTIAFARKALGYDDGEPARPTVVGEALRVQWGKSLIASGAQFAEDDPHKRTPCRVRRGKKQVRNLEEEM